MKIKVIIPILFFLALLTVGLFFGINLLMQKEINQEIIEVELTHQMTKEIIDLRDLTYDYLFNPSERARAQWWIQHDKIDRLLSPVSFERDNERDILAGLLKKQQLTEKYFLQLVRLTQASVSLENQVLISEQKNQLTNRILLASYEMLNSVFALNQYAEQGKDDLLRFNNLLSNLFLLFLFAIISTSAIYTILKIILPITKLRHVTDIIAEGNLDYRVGMKSRDEIGQLASSFDAMAMKLKESYVGLEKKVRDRTQDLEDAKIAARNVYEDLQVEKENLARAKAKDEALLSSIGDGVIATDKDGRIIYMNQSAEEMLGWKLKETIGILYSEKWWVEGEGGKVIPLEKQPIQIALSTGKKVTTTTHYIRKDKSKFPAATTITPVILNGEIIGAIDVFRDITHEWEINEMKSSFVSMASHQLKTPLTGIGWIVERLLSNKAGKLQKKQKDYLLNIYNSNKRMIKLVDDLLSVSRLEEGKIRIELKPLQVEEVIEGLIQEQKGLREKYKCQVVFEKPTTKLPLIVFDESLLRQVIHNLLTNAIRYSAPNSRVLVKLETKTKDFILTVADDGIGVPKNKQHRIFEKFFRADNAQKKQTDGTGLGLYITKMIVETMGGKIWFESAENKGTTFYVSLPLKGMKNQSGQLTDSPDQDTSLGQP